MLLLTKPICILHRILFNIFFLIYKLPDDANAELVIDLMFELTQYRRDCSLYAFVGI